VLQEDKCVAFLDRRPLFPGHVLVVPRRHYETLIDVPGSEIGTLFETVQRLCQALERGLSAEGIFVAVNCQRQRRGGGRGDDACRIVTIAPRGSPIDSPTRSEPSGATVRSRDAPISPTAQWRRAGTQAHRLREDTFHQTRLKCAPCDGTPRATRMRVMDARPPLRTCERLALQRCA
jgi:hypothetical protein